MSPQSPFSCLFQPCCSNLLGYEFWLSVLAWAIVRYSFLLFFGGKESGGGGGVVFVFSPFSMITVRLILNVHVIQLVYHRRIIYA